MSLRGASHVLASQRTLGYIKMNEKFLRSNLKHELWSYWVSCTVVLHLDISIRTPLISFRMVELTSKFLN
ncbi:hypothetical protein KCV07_g9, partial [Aureobasidium melanogenum]